MYFNTSALIKIKNKSGKKKIYIQEMSEKVLRSVAFEVNHLVFIFNTLTFFSSILQIIRKNGK